MYSYVTCMEEQSGLCFAALKWRKKGIWGFRGLDSCSKISHHFALMFFTPRKVLWLQYTFFPYLTLLFLIDACIHVYIYKLTAFPSQLSSKFSVYGI